jgi:hypothetical protein
MKFTKLSLIAALAVTSAFAGESTISGDAKLFYGTTDAGGTDLFNKNGAVGNAAISLDYSREVSSGITLNAGLTGVSTLGLENDLVSGTWINQNGVEDKAWIDTANITAKVANTTIVAGRQLLDTPFFTSETWNIAPNTFDAVVAVNQDIPDTTLVGAWVGRGNGDADLTVNAKSLGGGFTAFTGAVKPAYAFAIVNNSVEALTAQAWYYNIPTVANAYWLQADTSYEGVSLGLQYAGAELKSASDSSNAYAVKLGYNVAGADVYAAYSKRNDEGAIDISNIATGHGGASQSSLYTEAWWNYGVVGSNDAATVSVGASYDLGTVTLGLQHTNVDTGANNNDLAETTLTLGTKVGPLDATMALINASADDDARDGNTVQAYLTVPFSL